MPSLQSSVADPGSHPTLTRQTKKSDDESGDENVGDSQTGSGSTSKPQARRKRKKGEEGVDGRSGPKSEAVVLAKSK